MSEGTARISHLAYAPEIAAAMLQRQQASAVVAARTKIVDGAVGMVDMALDHLNRDNLVELDATQRATLVSNLLVAQLMQDRQISREELQELKRLIEDAEQKPSSIV